VVLRASYGGDDGQTLVCEVVDTGIGIPDDKLEAIFEPFTQLAPDAQGREGVGLGLPISRSLATLMGGSLTVVSRPGKGSTFRLSATLPETTGHQPVGAADERNICGYQGPRRRVLVVDDNPVNAVLLQDILDPLGFEVRTTTSGQEALQMAAAQPPDLVLLDLVMPQWDGVQTAQALRAMPALGTVPIIGLSASNADKGRKQAFVETCDAFLGKPVQLDDLLQTMGRLLKLEWQWSEAGARPEVGKTLQPAVLALLPADTRSALREAALSLDGEQVTAIIARIEGIDAALAGSLSDLVNRFDYQTILDALDQGRT
jgi:CheY-like chemotaxis protein